MALLFRSRTAQTWEYFLAVEVDDTPLVCLSRVDVHVCGAVVEEFCQGLHMDFSVRADRPLLINLLQGDFGFGALLNGVWVRDVIVRLKSLRAKAPKLCYYLGVFLLSYNGILFNEDRHAARIFAGGLGSALKLALVLLPDLRVCNKSIAILAGAVHRLWAVRRHQEWHG